MGRYAEVLDVGRFSYEDMDLRPVFAGRWSGKQQACVAQIHAAEGGGWV